MNGDLNFNDFTQWNIEYYEKRFHQHQMLKVFGRFNVIVRVLKKSIKIQIQWYINLNKTVFTHC